MKATVYILALVLALAVVALAVWIIRLDRKAKADREKDLLKLWEVIHAPQADNLMEDTVDVP